MTSFERVTTALETLGNVKRETASTAMAQCPAHDDNKASLSIKHSGDKVLLNCFAGCYTDDVAAALGLELKDLFDEEPETSAGPMLVRSYVYEAFNGDPWIIKDRFYPKTFRLRLPGAGADQQGLQGRQPILYHLPQLMAAKGQVVWVVEGEKDADTANRHGLIATTTPFGAGGKWELSYTQAIRKAQPSEVRVIADQDEKGRDFANKVRTSLRPVLDCPVRIMAPKAGKDLTDHFEAGFTADDFTPDLSASTRPRGMDGSSLLAKEMPELGWTIPNMLPQGFAILAGNPKCGKSWTALDIAIAVAMGGTALGGVRANQGSVLYLAREDGYRRLRSRMKVLLGRESVDFDLSKLELVPLEEEWVGGAEGVEAMEEWASERGDAKLVILDTWAKVEPQQDGGHNAYLSDYAMTSRYKAWADRHGATVMAIHHSRKSKAEDGDIFSQISGTRGFTGAADTMFFLERGEDKKGALHMTGRDVADQELELIRTGPLWLATDLLEEVSW